MLGPYTAQLPWAILRKFKDINTHAIAWRVLMGLRGQKHSSQWSPGANCWSGGRGATTPKVDDVFFNF